MSNDINITIDNREVNSMFHKMQGLVPTIMPKIYEDFISNTPIHTGNARHNTVLQHNTILTNYSYADALNNGASKQAPDGMISPTIDGIDIHIDQFIRNKI